MGIPRVPIHDGGLLIQQKVSAAFSEAVQVFSPLRDDGLIRTLVQNRLFGEGVAEKGIQLFGSPLVRVEFPH